ncbi:MAG: sugar ABC transporter ATP-binding protein [Nocardioidaceae bacterium]|nr:sugar ABC transporter ATP-binding protein [Nocardioidaceae bacterium]
MSDDRSLVCTGLVKTYSGITVLKGVDLTLRRGSVLGLIGENGAGKSTLSSIIAGVVPADGGQMTLDGRPYAPSKPAEALESGVVLIHQEIRMVGELSVAENIFLGRLPTSRGRIDRRRMNDDAADALAMLGAAIDPRRPVAGLSMAAQQEIEIAKAITRNPAYVIFDEPSASLGEEETEKVLDHIGVLRDGGAGIVYISHRLDEVRSTADEIVCLRDGQRVAHWDEELADNTLLVNAMVGREFTYRHQAPEPPRDEVALSVSGLGRAGSFADMTFSVARGEILGFAGLVGAGRTEVARALAGVDPADTGELVVDGRTVQVRRPADAIAAGIVMVPEDRKNQGLNLDRTAGENIALPWERQISRRGMVTPAAVAEVAARQFETLDIRGRADRPVGAMSGGNQQKVLLGRWLVNRPDVLIVDEPTRGVDVGAKMAIYQIIRELAVDGVAVIVISSELEEVLGLAHRVLVMSGGRQQGILTRDAATPERVMALAVRDLDVDGPPADGLVGATASAPKEN